MQKLVALITLFCGGGTGEQRSREGCRGVKGVSSPAYVPLSAVDPVANLYFLTEGVGLVPVVPQVGVGAHLHR